MYKQDTMKSNQRTVKVYDTTHRQLAELSNRFGISQAAIVDVAIDYIAGRKTIVFKPTKRGSKVNAATAKRGVKVVSA